MPKAPAVAADSSSVLRAIPSVERILSAAAVTPLIAEFGREALELGVRYLGVCCGAGPHHVRSLAEALGRTPPASRYSPDMSKHAFLGTDPRVRQEYRDYGQRI